MSFQAFPSIRVNHFCWKFLPVPDLAGQVSNVKLHVAGGRF